MHLIDGGYWPESDIDFEIANQHLHTTGWGKM